MLTSFQEIMNNPATFEPEKSMTMTKPSLCPTMTGPSIYVPPWQGHYSMSHHDKAITVCSTMTWPSLCVPTWQGHHSLSHHDMAITLCPTMTEPSLYVPPWQGHHSMFHYDTTITTSQLMSVIQQSAVQWLEQPWMIWGLLSLALL